MLGENLTAVYEELRSDFRMAKNTRFSPRVRSGMYDGANADYHYRSHYEYINMLERARHYERNDAVVGQGIRRLVSNVIQGGFDLDPKTGDDELDRIYTELWEEWAEEPDNCHSEGELTFHQMERLSLRSTIRDGDIWHLLREDGKIQAVEGHRPRTPNRTRRNVVNGVMLDNDAKRSEVWISKEVLSPFQTIRYSDIQRFKIRDDMGQRVVLQIYFPDRFSQRRGISALAPASDIIGMHDDLQFATLVKAQMAALLVLLREQDIDSPPGSSAPPIGGDLPTTYEMEGGVTRISGIQAGIDYLAPPGQTIKGFSPQIPNEEFFAHSLLLLTFVAVNLDLPVQVLMLDPQRSNFSSWRGAIDQARIRFREIQSDMVEQFHSPVFKWKARQWASGSRALRRRIGNNPHWLRHQWKKPRFTYIDPDKDSRSDRTRSESFLASLTQIYSDKGEDFEIASTEIVEDRIKLIRKSMQAVEDLKSEFPECDATWRDVLSATLGAVSTTSLSSRLDEQSVNE